LERERLALHATQCHCVAGCGSKNKKKREDLGHSFLRKGGAKERPVNGENVKMRGRKNKSQNIQRKGGKGGKKTKKEVIDA